MPARLRKNTDRRPRLWPVLLLFAITLALMAGKLPGMPTEGFLSHLVSLSSVPKHMRQHVEYILFIPLSGVLVAFFRLTLGVSVFSFFRPILVAIAFRAMGVEAGLAFLIAALTLVALVRPLLRDVHYYARVPVILSILVSVMALVLAAGKSWHLPWMERLAYFPIIALSLTCESFAKLLDDKGVAEAVWRAAATIGVGLAITGAASIPGAMPAMLRFPELLLAQTACVLLIAGFLNYRLFEGKNPLRRRSARQFPGQPAPEPRAEKQPECGVGVS
jgi:uncharacterized protein with transglutaminase domain